MLLRDSDIDRGSASFISYICRYAYKCLPLLTIVEQSFVSYNAFRVWRDFIFIYFIYQHYFM